MLRLGLPFEFAQIENEIVMLLDKNYSKRIPLTQRPRQKHKSYNIVSISIFCEYFWTIKVIVAIIMGSNECSIRNAGFKDIITHLIFYEEYYTFTYSMRFDLITKYLKYVLLVYTNGRFC